MQEKQDQRNLNLIRKLIIVKFNHFEILDIEILIPVCHLHLNILF